MLKRRVFEYEAIVCSKFLLIFKGRAVAVALPLMGTKLRISDSGYELVDSHSHIRATV